jgi:hypothetical protein
MLDELCISVDECKLVSSPVDWFDWFDWFDRVDVMCLYPFI